jgi:hypothetical protein
MSERQHDETILELLRAFLAEAIEFLQIESETAKLHRDHMRQVHCGDDEDLELDTPDEDKQSFDDSFREDWS